MLGLHHKIYGPDWSGLTPQRLKEAAEEGEGVERHGGGGGGDVKRGRGGECYLSPLMQLNLTMDVVNVSFFPTDKLAKSLQAAS